MRGFWLPIGLRAVAVFALGMLAWGGIHSMKHHTHFGAIEASAPEAAAAARMDADRAAGEARENAVSAADNAAKATMAAMGSNALLAHKLGRFGSLARFAGATHAGESPPAFVLDGQQAGTFTRFKGSRGKRDTPAQFMVVVSLMPGVRGAPCDIVPVQPDDFDIDKGFRCAVDGERGLAKVGVVRFEPSGITHGILASEHTAGELAKGDPFAIDADLSGPMHVTIKGDEGELVRLNSDSEGTALVVNDENGKAVVRMKAGKDGFSITVDTTGR